MLDASTPYLLVRSLHAPAGGAAVGGAVVVDGVNEGSCVGPNVITSLSVGPGGDVVVAVESPTHLYS